MRNAQVYQECNSECLTTPPEVHPLCREFWAKGPVNLQSGNAGHKVTILANAMYLRKEVCANFSLNAHCPDYSITLFK